jgi:GrpB-like predicted nucleotidyltransferase (UPF0157 family)
VRIFRFDDEVSVPIDAFGSRFKLCPLVDTGTGGQAQVQVLHLPAGGLVGRHPAAGRQLFAVVAGVGWVTGGDGRRRDVGPGTAALWEAGEEHEAGSDGGLTAVCVEGAVEVTARAVTMEIVVADYDPAWPTWFEAVRAHVWPAVADLALRIEHVGSTSVPGLAAKPIVDMDIVVASEDAVRPVIARLAGIGYRWRGDLGVVGREAFARPPGVDLPPHHLYLVVEDNTAHRDHYLLRDLLRADPDARARYGALKRRNAAEVDGDIDAYGAAKADLVAELLARARADRGPGED